MNSSKMKADQVDSSISSIDLVVKTWSLSIGQQRRETEQSFDLQMLNRGTFS